MATYNGKEYISEQLHSVLNELLPGDEIIVVDDASQDGTPEFIDSFKSPLIRMVRNSDNIGVLRTFEKGLSLAKKDIVFLCDQDDVWLPGKRSAFVAEFLADPRTMVVLSDAQLIDAAGTVTASSFMATRGGFRGSVIATLWRNCYLGCAMAMRQELLAATLPIPRYVPMHDMWFGLLGAVLGRHAYIPTPYIQYRRHVSNLSPSRHQGIGRMVRWRIALLFALLCRLGSLLVGRHKPNATSAPRI